MSQLRSIAVTFALAVAVVSCGAPSVTPTPSASRSAPVDSLTFGVTALEKNLTPWTQSTGYPGYYMMMLIFDSLYWPDQNNVPQPWLATSAVASSSGAQWTVHLHNGVTWQDGQPLTSADVSFTVSYLKAHPRPRWPQLLDVTSVATPDATTAVFTLDKPVADFLSGIIADLPILPQHIWQGIADPTTVTSTAPIGSGPYKLATYQPQNEWIFQANPSYFKGAPKVKQIVVPYISDPNTELLAIQTGKADAGDQSVPPQLVQSFQQTKGVSLLQGADYRGVYLYMNNGRAPFSSPQFREAILDSLNLSDVVTTLLLGQGTQGSPGFVNKLLAWSNASTSQQHQDLTKARQLLAQLGYTQHTADGTLENNSGSPLQFNLIVSSTDPVQVRAAQLIATQVGALGIKLNPTSLAATVLSNTLWPDHAVGAFKGNYDIGLQSWAPSVQINPVTLNQLFNSSTTIGTLNRAGYSSAEFDQLGAQLSTEVTPTQRQPTLTKIQQLLATDVPAIPLYFGKGIAAYRPETFNQWVYYQGYGILNKATFG